MDPEDTDLLVSISQSIASGCSPSQLLMYLNAGHAGLTIRENINETIYPMHGTLAMTAVAGREDTDPNTVAILQILMDHGADMDRPDAIIGSTPLNLAADFGKPRSLQWLVDRGGARIDRHPNVSPTLPVYLSCQNNHPQCVAVLVRAAIQQKDLLYTLDRKSKGGKPPGYICLERGHVECMGALAMGGADLRQVFGMYWVPTYMPRDADGNASQVDPDLDIQPHASLQSTLLSFTTLQCAHCNKFSTDLNRCSQCRMAHFCSKDCQRANWKFHKHCCKKLRKGQDMVVQQQQQSKKSPNNNKTMTMIPEPKSEPFGFHLYEFSEVDSQSERPHDIRSKVVTWEYNAGSRGKPEWRRYPKRIEEGLESLLELGSPRYMYRPGKPEADGYYEEERSPRGAPDHVATNYVYFVDMLERDYYSGAIRAVRRNGSRNPPDTME